MTGDDEDRRAHWDRLLDATALEITAQALGEDPDADLVGRRIGPYVVESWLGAGGMGDVYRARDHRLQRDVALKVLPHAFALDAAARDRFAREAQVLASLDHPRIARIHGFEESGGVSAIALELVEGPTLAGRLREGRVPVAEAIAVAAQIADALEAAHERGIVHRDLKPANVGLRPDGTVKVLDFGLAVTQGLGDGTPVEAPVLGTPAYMSPEHAAGRAADRRNDVWAFGVVLYEMLAGRCPFEGGRRTDVIAAVERQAVEWDALPAATPAGVRRLLERCLDRDVRRRLRDIGEARIALEAPDLLQPDRSDAGRPGPRGHGAWPAVAGAAAAGSLAAILWWTLAPRPAGPRQATRFTYTLARDQQLAVPTSHHVVALSPDGTRLAYVGNGRLYLRALSELAARPIAGTDIAGGTIVEPAFSPDGQALAFWSGADRTIKTIGVAGGAPLTVCAAEVPSGLAWTPEGLFYGAPGQGILRVPAGGGTPTLVARVEADEHAHGPQLAPGGALLFTIATGTGADRWDRARVILQSLTTGVRTTVLERATDARYVATGHLVYASPDGVQAVPFDVRRQVVSGPIVATLAGVRRSSGRRTGAAQFGISDAGSIVYVPGAVRRRSGGPHAEIGVDAIVVVADRTGRVERLPLPPGPYRDVRVSPDGRRLAIAAGDREDAAIYIYDRSAGGPLQRLTVGGHGRAPVWSADGRHVAFQSDRDGPPAVYWQLADGSEPATRLTTPAPGEEHEPESWMPDGSGFLYSVGTRDGTSLWTLTLRDGRSAPFGEIRSSIPLEATFSPDGRWVAYATSAPGPLSTAIGVQPYPATGARYPLVVHQPPEGPLNSPHKPLWSPDGGALFYVPRIGGFEMVRVSTRPRFAFGPATPLPRPFQPAPPDARRSHDVTPDGRIVGLVSTESTMPDEFDRGTIQVVLDWLPARPPD